MLHDEVYKSQTMVRGVLATWMHPLCALERIACICIGMDVAVRPTSSSMDAMFDHLDALKE